MKLARFITANAKQISAEWEEFAQAHVPAAGTMSLEERRDHIAGMLKAIVRDLETSQSKKKQAAKSKGKDDAHVDGKTAANAHGTDRAVNGYTPVEMVSEFRALRASVIRLWIEAHGNLKRAHLEDLTRFNEAIDQLLAESIAKHAQELDRSRDLFLGVLGHDLRNPLGAIMMSASVMMMQEGPNWPHARTASRMLDSGRRMDALIHDLLDFTRSRLGHGIPIVRADIDLETVCRQTMHAASCISKPAGS
jgi:K+-sensing histidine kinase KdpD